MPFPTIQIELRRRWRRLAGVWRALLVASAAAAAAGWSFGLTHHWLAPTLPAPVASAQGLASEAPSSCPEATGGMGAATAGASAGELKEATGPQFPIVLNTASAEELDRVPGIGPVLAARILDHRDRWGGFRRLDDLLEVPGIGARTLERILPYLVLSAEEKPQ